MSSPYPKTFPSCHSKSYFFKSNETVLLFFFSLQIMDFFFPTDCYKSLSDKSLIFCKAKTCSSACGCYSFVLQNVWPRLLVPQLCIVQHKFWYSSTPLRSFFALLGGFDWWKAVCVKKTALCVLVFLLGMSYRVIHLQLKCSVRTVILFFFDFGDFSFVCFDVAFRMWFDTWEAESSSLRNAQCLLWC